MATRGDDRRRIIVDNDLEAAEMTTCADNASFKDRHIHYARRRELHGVGKEQGDVELAADWLRCFECSLIAAVHEAGAVRAHGKGRRGSERLRRSGKECG